MGTLLKNTDILSKYMDKGHVKEKQLKVDNFLVNKYHHTNYQVDNDSKFGLIHYSAFSAAKAM